MLPVFERCLEVVTMMVDVIVVVVDGVLAVEVISGHAPIVASVAHICVVRQQCRT